jgi:hypothetical protein
MYENRITKLGDQRTSAAEGGVVDERGHAAIGTEGVSEIGTF